MLMTTITNNDVKNLKSELANALTVLSKGELDIKSVKEIVDRSVDNIDLDNSALFHKGTNWYAKEILKMVGIH
jgi:hypothetical protein